MPTLLTSSRPRRARALTAAVAGLALGAGALTGLTTTAAASPTVTGAASAKPRPALISATSEYTEDGRVRLAIDHRTRPQERLLGYLASIDTTTATAGRDFWLFWAPDRAPRLSHSDGTPTGCRGIKHRTKIDGDTRLETIFVPGTCLGSGGTGGAAPRRVRVSHELDVQRPDGTCSIDTLPAVRPWQRWLTPGEKATSVSGGARGSAAARGC